MTTGTEIAVISDRLDPRPRGGDGGARVSASPVIPAPAGIQANHA